MERCAALPVHSLSQDGMSGMGHSSTIPMMQAHVDSMRRMSPEQISTMMAGHERKDSQMMDGGQVRHMEMSETPELERAERFREAGYGRPEGWLMAT